MRRNAADVGNMGRFGEDNPGSACGAGAQMLDMPVISQSIIGAVLAHRRDDDAIAGSDRTEADRLKKQRCWHGKMDSDRTGIFDPGFRRKAIGVMGD